MKTSTAYNHQTRLSSKLRTHYWYAIQERVPHAVLLDRLRCEVWQDPALKRCPGWVATTLSTIRAELSDQIYSHLVWAFIGSDGLPRVLNSLSEEDRQRVFKGEIKGNYFWLKTTKSSRTLEDGTIVETVVKVPTIQTY